MSFWVIIAAHHLIIYQLQLLTFFLRHCYLRLQLIVLFYQFCSALLHDVALVMRVANFLFGFWGTPFLFFFLQALRFFNGFEFFLMDDGFLTGFKVGWWLIVGYCKRFVLPERLLQNGWLFDGALDFASVGDWDMFWWGFLFWFEYAIVFVFFLSLLYFFRSSLNWFNLPGLIFHWIESKLNHSFLYLFFLWGLLHLCKRLQAHWLWIINFALCHGTLWNFWFPQCVFGYTDWRGKFFI